MYTEPSLSACIVLYNSGPQAAQTIRCFQESDIPLELFVVNNAPGDDSVHRLRWQCPGLQCITAPKNLGYGRANNLVLPRLRSKYHIICNPDVTFDSDLLGKMVQYMELNRECVILTPRVFFPDGTEQFLPKRAPTVRYLLGGRLEKFPGPFKGWRSEYTLRDVEVEAPTSVYFAPGCFMMIRTALFHELRGFDPRYFLYHEDSDLSRQALRYGNIVYHPQFFITHEWQRRSSSSFSGAMHHIASTFRYFNKWGWEW